MPHGIGAAVDPANAVLNYAYGGLEAQCRQALAAKAFDLACGFLHADKQYRDSLVYDLRHRMSRRSAPLPSRLGRPSTLPLGLDAPASTLIPGSLGERRERDADPCP